MKLSRFSIATGILMVWLICLDAAPVTSQLLIKQPSLSPQPESGLGDSICPIISADGRFVVFASRAVNLVTDIGTQSAPGVMNVYLRDRDNGQITLLTVDVAGSGGGNGDSFPVDISADGHFVLFESSASNLIVGDTNNATDVFLRDLISKSNVLVSVANDPGVGNRPSRTPVMTPDARFVAFVSAATNLVDGDTNGIPDVFVRDLQIGQTTLVSAGAVSAGAASRSTTPSITPDGRFIAFMSSATNLVSGDTERTGVYLRDLIGGQTYSISANAMQFATNAFPSNALISYGQAVSDDGRFVTFLMSPDLKSVAPPALVVRCEAATGAVDIISTNGVPAMDYENAKSIDVTSDGRFVVYVGDTNGGFGSTGAVYMWDALSKVTTTISADVNGGGTSGLCAWPTLDGTGHYVLFYSTATNLTQGATNADWGLYLRDVTAGVTRLVSPPNTAVPPVTSAAMSANADFVVYEGAGCIPHAHPFQTDVLLRDVQRETNELISSHDPNLRSSSAAGWTSRGISCLSSNGRFFVYSTTAGNVSANNTNGWRDIFVEDRITGENYLVTVGANGEPANGPSFSPSISANGRFVVFISHATNLVNGVADTNRLADVFVRDLYTGSTVQITAPPKIAAIEASTSATISGDGRCVLFMTTAGGSQTYVTVTNRMYMRDMVAGTITPLATNTGPNVYAMSASGRYLAMRGAVNTTNALMIYDLQNNQRIRTTLFTYSIGATAVSDDGAISAAEYVNGSQVAITVMNLANGTTNNFVVQPDHLSLGISGNGGFLVYTTTNKLGFEDVFLVNTSNSVRTSITTGVNGEVANGPSFFSTISVDGRYVAYVSFATNLAANDTNNAPDVFLYDRIAGTTRIVSANIAGNGTAMGRSMAPNFSPDGKTLAFESWAGDIVAQDFNQSGDLFAVNMAAVAPVYPGDPVLMFETPVNFAGMATARGGVTFSWMVDPTRVYKVQFKDDLNEPVWQDFAGTTAVIGSTQYAQDVAGVSQRFYRVVVQ
jgi:Tol biopolymer transport system component